MGVPPDPDDPGSEYGASEQGRAQSSVGRSAVPGSLAVVRGACRLAVLRRNGKRRQAVGTGPEVRSTDVVRTCATEGCQARLSRYNLTLHCSIHHGWDQEEPQRRKRAAS